MRVPRISASFCIGMLCLATLFGLGVSLDVVNARNVTFTGGVAGGSPGVNNTSSTLGFDVSGPMGIAYLNVECRHGDDDRQPLHR